MFSENALFRKENLSERGIDKLLKKLWNFSA